MPHSHHSHSGQFCKHAVGTLEDVVKEAIRQKFEIFGLTEHVPRYREADLYPEEKDTSLIALENQFRNFLVEAHRLKARYSSQITLLVGLETEYITDLDLVNLEKTLDLAGDKVQYVVGSVHHVNGIPIDFDLATFNDALASMGDDETFLSAYFDAQYRVMERIKPEIVGHFDLCRLWNPALRFQDYPAVYDKIVRNVQYAVGYGALFEVNAAAFKKKWNTAYPGEDIVKIIIDFGGRFALSDDSHGPQAVGLNYHRLPRYLKSAGITELWYLEHSHVPNTAGRNVGPAKLKGEWAEHAFWST
ncbi:hypothetical protein D9619_009564 [Psilocybe cf. subviscida]|uniref:Histidinol-phosphatase n=1 Tax=Psilocybe cf. subviscida TaxID=2480587 RepID=A0A8H5BL32_9AGAR|nr:hypothetical protein D9619_009564 [Psilocybe cf. subviscida]